MEETIAELRRQLEEERQAREEAERRQEEERQAREEAERRRNDMCSPTHCSPFSIAATTFCLDRSELRRMQLSRLRATQPTQ